MKQLDCQAIIFDFDGVLIDSSAVIGRHWRRWAAEHGLDPALNVMHSHRLVEIVRHVAPHLDAEREAAHLGRLGSRRYRWPACHQGRHGARPLAARLSDIQVRRRPR